MRPKLNHQPTNNGSSQLENGERNVTPNSPTDPIAGPSSGDIHSNIAQQQTTTSSSSTGVLNPIFVSDLHDSDSGSNVKLSKKPLLKHHRSSPSGSTSDSSGLTTVTTASDNQRTLTTSSVEVGESNRHHHHHHHRNHRHHRSSPGKCLEQSCDYCYQFHVNNHRTALRPNSSSNRNNHPYQLYGQQSYAPYPPQWYYLLAADTKEFRKHKHSHYRKDCRTCRSIVKRTFEQYYLNNNNLTTSVVGGEQSIGDQSETPESSNSLVPISFMSDHHSDPLLDSINTPNSATSSPFPMVVMPRRRANCGHSCLKFSILFYCSVAVILAICFICYLTKMFGYLEMMSNMPSDSTITVTSSPMDELLISNNGQMVNDSEIPSLTNSTTNSSSINSIEEFNQTPSMFEMVQGEVIGIIVCSALMIIFFLGLIGAFLESVLCLRIFGAILSYLFLLTFGAALYINILLVISRVPTKLVLSTVSCSAIAITLHAALAIAPFAFADLIVQEKEDEKSELSSTYFKYPSVRFLPNGAYPSGKGRSYFSLPFLSGSVSRMWNSRTLLGGRGGVPIISDHQFVSSPPSSSVRSDSSPRTSPIQQHDNISSEDLIPSANQHQSSSHPSTVRFNDNWI